MKSVILLVLSSLVLSPVCFTQNADSIAAAACKSLRSAEYKNVRVSTHGNAVTLTGSVALYATSEEAVSRVERIRGIGIVRNDIQVDTSAIPDPKLQANLEIAVTATLHRQLRSVPNLSDVISVQVHSGVVILDGDLPNMQLKQAIFDAVAHTQGVRGITDSIRLQSNPELLSVWPPEFDTPGPGQVQ